MLPDNATAEEILKLDMYVNSKTKVEAVDKYRAEHPELVLEQACLACGITKKAYENARYRLKNPVGSYASLRKAWRNKGLKNKADKRAKAREKSAKLLEIQVPEPQAPPEQHESDEMEVLIVKGKPGDIAKILSGRYGK